MVQTFSGTWSPAYAKRPLTKVALKNVRLAYAKRTIVKIGSESLPRGAQLKFEAGRSFFWSSEIFVDFVAAVCKFFSVPASRAGRTKPVGRRPAANGRPAFLGNTIYSYIPVYSETALLIHVCVALLCARCVLCPFSVHTTAVVKV